MVSSAPSLQIIALILSAFLGAITAQFLSFYRERRHQLEEIKNILYLISTLEEGEIRDKAGSPNSFFWSLREELFNGYKKNTLFLGERTDQVMNVIREFPNEEGPHTFSFDETGLKFTAQSAYRSLDEINPRQIFWQSLLSFVGFSQEKHADKLEVFLEEANIDNSDSTQSIKGYFISKERLEFRVLIPVLVVAVLSTGLISDWQAAYSLQPNQYVQIILVLLVAIPFIFISGIPVIGETIEEQTENDPE